MALGFGRNVASLKATLTLDDDGFIRGMAEASTKLDAYNAKLKEEGVGKRLATMASRDYAKQLFNEARGVDQATQSHGRLITVLQSAQRHWKLVGATAVGVTAGVVQMTGAFGGLGGVLGQLGATVLPVFNGALTALLVPFTSLAAIAAAAAGPLTVFSTVLGGIGLGALLGFKNALASSGPQFAPFRRAVGSLKEGFDSLTHSLAQDFMPWFMKVAPIAGDILGEFGKLAQMAGKGGLSGLFKGLAQGGFARLYRDIVKIVSPIGDVIARVIKFAFGRGGREGQSMIVNAFTRFGDWASKAFAPIIRWFDRQHFTRTGARWASEIVASVVPVVANGLWNAVKALFSSVGAWGKIGMIAGAAFAANFLTGGLLTKIGLAVGRAGLGAGGSILGGGAAAGGGGVAGGGAAAGGGGVVGLLGASGIAAIVGVAVPAALVYLSSRQPKSSQTRYGAGPGITPRGPGSPGYMPDPIRADAAKDVAALKRVAEAEKELNQQINFGGKSARGWSIAVGESTRQAGRAQAAIQDMKDRGIISADDAAKRAKANLQQYASQEDAIARKATAASQNTARFGAATRAQYAHVAALARTSAQLAQAIDSIPSQKYVSLVLSITENLKSQGRGPGSPIQTQTGGYIGGSGSGDIVPALLEPGEAVLNRTLVSALGGKPAIDMMNASVPRFASGGFVLNYAGGVPPSKVQSTWGFKAPKSLDEHEKHAVERALDERQKAMRKATTPKQRHAAWIAYQHAVNKAKAARRGGYRAAGEAYYNRIQTSIGNWISLEQSSQDPNMDSTLGAMYGRELGFIKGGLSWARQHKFNEGQWVWDARNLENTIAGQQQQTAAASAQEISSFLAQQQTFLSEFAGNIIVPGAAAVLSGSSSATAAAGGGSSGGPIVPNRYLPAPKGGVTIHNHFTQTPPDSFVHIRKAALQAAAVFG